MIRRSTLLASIATAALCSSALTAQARELELHFHPIPVHSIAYTYTVPDDPHQTAYRVGALVSDGTRWIAFTSGQGQMRVYDTKTARLSAPVAVDPRCGPTAIHRGLVLIACITEQNEGPLPTPAPSVLDLARHTLTKVAGDFHGEDQPDAVGRYWIAEESCTIAGMVGCDTQYVNRRTGRVRSNTNIDQIGPRPSLDSRTLAPLPKPSVVLKPCQRTTLFQEVCFAHAPLRLFRAGHRPVRLSRCAGKVGCFDPTLGGGWVTWTSLQDSYGYRIRDGARIVVKPSSSCPGGTAGLAATRYQLIEGQCNGLFAAHVGGG